MLCIDKRPRVEIVYFPRALGRIPRKWRHVKVFGGIPDQRTYRIASA